MRMRPLVKNLEDHVDVVGDNIDEGEEGKDEKKASRRKYQRASCRARLRAER